MRACAGQRCQASVCLYHSPPYLLRQRLSLNLERTDWLDMLARELPGPTVVSTSSKLELHRWHQHSQLCHGSRDPSSGLKQQIPYPQDFFPSAPSRIFTLHILLFKWYKGLHGSGLSLHFLFNENTVIPTQTRITKACIQWTLQSKQKQ